MSGECRLDAFVCVDTELSVKEIRKQLQLELPQYMIPSTITLVDKIPLTPNGKVDYRRLPDPFSQRDLSEYVEPVGQIETAVAEVWGLVLGVAKISATDDFFSLGGHSLIATQVVAKLQKVLGRSVSLKLLFSHPVLRDLASAIDGDSEHVDLPLVQHAPNRNVSVASYSQNSLWMLAALNPGDTSYNMVSAVTIAGGIDSGILKSVFIEIAKRHQVLTTRFEMQ